MQSPARFSVNTDPLPDASPVASAHHSDTVPDVFYSDQDVVILHDIVALAQHDLDSAPTPNPLPAAALFKAYDEVLPQYGIDPDGDHHLSAFVFRIGGEEGNAPLLEKFQTILGHLGITVELGEGDEHEHDMQLSPTPSTTRSVRSVFNHALRLHPRTTPERYSLHRQQALASVPELELGDASQEQTKEPSLASPASIAPRRNVLRGNGNGLAGTVAIGPDQGDIGNEGKVRPMTNAFSRRADNGPPPELESDLNRWIRVAKAQRANIFTSPARTVGTSAPSAANMTTPDRPIESRQSQVSQSMRDELARPANPSPPSLMSLVDAWRGAALQYPRYLESPSQNRASPMIAPGHPQIMPTTLSRPQQPQQEAHATKTIASNYDPQQDQYPHDLPDPSSATKNAAATAVLSQARQEDTQREATRTSLTQEQTVQIHVQQQKLMYRAARARELYLASKFFNLWADRTARRLEREGVARRHMIRFRCFRGWSQMPSSRHPAIDRIRLSAVLHKLRRATSEQQQQLDELAAYATRHFQSDAALKALAAWRRRMAVSEAQGRAIQRCKARVALRWRMLSATHAASLEAARLRGQQTREVMVLMTWQDQAEDHRTQAIAARDIGDANLGFNHLRDWWDKSETSRRAAVYRQFIYTEKAVHGMSIWNLAARSQAFKWNNDYKAASRVFDKWDSLTEYDHSTRVAAHEHYTSRARDGVLHGFDIARSNQRRGDRMQGRVRLFITATKTLKVFDEVVKRRTAEEKDRIKKRLMSKYKQASSARKKRQFFSALSQWQQSANEAKACAQLGIDARASLDDRKQSRVLDAWSQQTEIHDNNMDHAVQHYVLSWSDQWTAFAAQASQREALAWEAWALDRQRTAVKNWSIMSLQREGQAHTATAAYQKHKRDRRRRALQLWKQQSDKAKGVEDFDADLGFTPAPASLRSYRQSWRFFSDRGRGVSNRSSVMSTADTPTRWTGQLSLMSSTMGQNPMPALEEADEKDIAKSPVRVGQGFDSPVRRRSDDNVFGGLASTTPLAPVPSHLNQGLRSGIGNNTRPPAWPRSAFKQRSQYVPSNLGPAAAQRMFPRSLHERPSHESSTKAGISSSPIFSKGSEAGDGGPKVSSPASSALAMTPRPVRNSRAPSRGSYRGQEVGNDKNPEDLEG